MAFEWDARNAGHFAHRGISPKDVEEAFADPLRYAADIGVINGEYRAMIIGVTVSGRLLTAIYTFRYDEIRVVTAYPASPKHRRWYAAGRSLT